MYIEIPDELVEKVLGELEDLPIVSYPYLTRLWPLFNEFHKVSVRTYLKGDLVTFQMIQSGKVVGTHGKRVNVQTIEANHLKLTAGTAWEKYYQIVSASYAEDEPFYTLEEVK